ncbi:MAG: type II CAAX endopeptidase family protein [Oscillospiraceae bacterium]
METKTINYKSSVMRVGFAMLALIGITICLQGVLGGVMNNLMPEFLEKPYGVWVLSYAPLYLIAVPIYLLIIRGAANTMDKEKTKLSAKSTAKVFFISIAALYFGNLLSILITTAIGALKGSAVVNPIINLQAGSGVLYNILFGVILAPIGEELLFRLVLFKKLGGYGDKAYILISSTMFALFHGNLSQLLYAFALGAIFAYIMAKTGNVLYSMALHIFINAYGMVLAPLALENSVATVILVIAILSCAVTGLVLFIGVMRKKQLTFAPPIYDLPQHPVRATLTSPGMAAAILICLALVFTATFM